MSYLVLARKYRPQIFDRVIDQDHVTRTLTNAIASDRVAHAILFTGPRGTGKTTVARILAKALNCAGGPTAAPCNTCRSCTEITSGNAVDVFEIDGASNNSVDQVRELRDNVRYMPAHSLYKIYIIDEVHMLSTPAFNALLKTLEEPPGHVMFIFATTEPHKIPVTILSRCQRHDFKRIKLESITQHMQSLCSKEGIEISSESLAVIAREAGGSMRDALSLLDQVMTCSEGATADEQVLDLLGVIDRKVVFDLSAAIIQGKIPEILEILDNVYDHGHDMKRLYSTLVEHFRNLLIVKLGKKVSLLVDLPANEIQRMQQQVKDLSAAYLNQIFDLLFKQEPTVKFSMQPKLALEMVFFKLLQLKPALPIEELIDKLDRLRSEIANSPGTADQGRNDSAARTQTEIPAAKSAPTNLRSSMPVQRTGSEGNRTAAGPAADMDLDTAWQKIQETISVTNPSLAANLSKCKLKQPDANRLQIEVIGNGFNLSMIQRPKHLDIIKKVCSDLFSKEMHITITGKNEPELDNRKKKNNDNRLKKEALNHPLLAEALDIFDGKVVGVKILKEDDS